MNHPHRDINGSGRILYRTIERRKELEFSSVGYSQSMNPTPTKTVEIFSRVTEGDITEWSPSGDYVLISDFWHKATDVELLEVLK
jgi:hypothetical protein